MELTLNTISNAPPLFPDRIHEGGDADTGVAWETQTHTLRRPA